MKKSLNETETKNLYIHRCLLNVSSIREWAKKQGFKSSLDDGDIHVTIAYSSKKLEWPNPLKGKLTIIGGERSIKQLGDAFTLCFESEILKERWQELRDMGASWDFSSYISHITLTYEEPEKRLEDIIPFKGDLVFGPEIFAEIVENWADDIEEKEL